MVLRYGVVIFDHNITRSKKKSKYLVSVFYGFSMKEKEMRKDEKKKC